MEKVKIFTQGTSNTFDELERKVNNWLNQNKDITITSRKVTTATGTNIFLNCTIVLFYQTNEKRPD